MFCALTYYTCGLQVFPLLMQEFSSKDQASLACEFLYSIPVILLEAIFPWMASFLSLDEKVDVKHCIKEILSEETSLQEVDPKFNHHSGSNHLPHYD